jgi:endonuclease/exonuclease/phosphatase family metal-dependent hydrolase/ketosteroid isomerase-like protein
VRATPLKVLTWNLYLGGDVGGVINADPAVTPSRMAALWQMVRHTDFPSRARVIADRICALAPDVVGLQEAYRWSTIEKLAPGIAPPSEHLEYDLLAILLDELQQRGASYFTAVRSMGVDLVLPSTGGPDVRLQDSVAILLRTAPDSPWSWENPRQGRFRTNLQVRIDGEPFTISRGWASVDLRCSEGAVRAINTHLEYFDPDVQPAQVQEILDGPASVKGPLVWMGDFNCGPDSPSWKRLAGLGYRDVWNESGSGLGFTSAQDEDLRNPLGVEYERIDWILCRGDVQVENAALVGDGERTPQGLWPSDHLGVAAALAVAWDEERPGRSPRRENPTEPLAVVREMFARFEKGNVTGVMEFIHPDGRWHFPGDPKILPWAGDYRGSGMMRFFILCAQALVYELYEAHTFYTSGEYVTVLSRERCLVKGTGERFENDLAAVVRVVEGKVVEFLEYSDTARMQAAFQKQAAAQKRAAASQSQ